jgi:predicted amidohydrolase YtcJ
MQVVRRLRPILAVVIGVLVLGSTRCSRPEPADLLLVGGRVYTLAWSEPDREGGPSRDAPRTPDGWRPDAEAVAIRGSKIVFTGSRADGDGYRGPDTRVVDLKGATAIPGLIDAHVHLANLGASLDRVNLVGVATEEEAVQRVVARAATVPKGEWIIGWGWDEGAWTSHLPDMKRLSAAVPDHPVVLHGLHTFAAWGNQLAFARAGITRDTPSTAGGEIKKDAKGNPTGILVNNAQTLLTKAVPPPAPDQLAERVITAIDALIAHGYTSTPGGRASRCLRKASSSSSAASRRSTTAPWDRAAGFSSSPTTIDPITTASAAPSPASIASGSRR